MRRYLKYVSVFLLAVFSIGVLPAPVLHDLLANHKDAADNHCQYYHKDLGRHIEQKETHCDTFKTNTPLYDSVKLSFEFTEFSKIISLYSQAEVNSLALSISPNLPSRAPPVA